MPTPPLSDALAKQALDAVERHGWLKAGEVLGLHPNTVANRARIARQRATGTVPAPGQVLDFKRDIRAKRLFITSAQNASPIHKGFLRALLAACEHMGAELVVVPYRYKNPTSIFASGDKQAEWWHADLVPYLCNERKALNRNLWLLGDVKTQPTAESPLSGFETMTHSESAILGHPRLQFRTVPVPRSRLPKILTTTGSVTVQNYTDTKAGKKGDFHHTIGAAFVDIRGDRFHLRQINAEKDGSFIDLATRYTCDGKVQRAPRALALVMGDTHVAHVDPGVVKATFMDDDAIVRTLRPRSLVWHDVHDGYACNPHHFGNVFNALAKRRGGKSSVEAEVRQAIEFVERHTPQDAESVIVSSNHDDFLARWVRDSDWRRDPDNAEFYLRTALAMVQSTRSGAGGLEVVEPFAYWVAQLATSGRVRCLHRDESFELAGIEMGFHGDRGPNGARGALKGFRAIGPKVVIGHGHSPGIEQGAYQVGTNSLLRLEYTSGPSSWLHSDCVIYANGKRSLLNIIDGEWH